MNVLAEPAVVRPCDHATIIEKVKNCPRLPSLRSIETALRELLHADNRFTTQISEVIRRDPSLTARLLRLVNSVYYGLTHRSIALRKRFFISGSADSPTRSGDSGDRGFPEARGSTAFQWREFWQHCIATAILTRELTSSMMRLEDESDYVAGLVHDVGRIVMASAFPRHFNAIFQEEDGEEDEGILERESRILGVDHTELGAIYLSQHQLPGVLAEVARHHHSPERAEKSRELTAAVHIADILVRYARIGTSGNSAVVEDESWLHTEAWRILHPNAARTDQLIAQANLKRTLERLPHILEGLV